MTSADYQRWKENLVEMTGDPLSSLSREGLRYLHFLMRRAQIKPHDYSIYPDHVDAREKALIDGMLGVPRHNGSPLEYTNLTMALQNRLLHVLINKL